MKAVVASYNYIWSYPAKMDTDIFNIYLIVGTSKGSNVFSSFKSIGTEIRPKEKNEDVKYNMKQHLQFILTYLFNTCTNMIHVQ